MPSRIISIAVLTAIAAIISGSKTNTPTPTTTLTWNSLSEVHQALFQKINRNTGLIVQGKDEVYFKEYRGDFNNDTVIPIASASKWLSAAVIMTLVDEGKITLDDKAATYLPELRDGGEKELITIRQLLSHTSGIRPNPACLLDARQSLKKCAETIAEDSLLAKPGTVFAYGGGSMQVAGAIAERVTEQSWSELFSERIAKPLGMQYTIYGTLTPVGTLITTSQNPRIAGGAQSSLNDYTKFMEMMLDCGEYKGKTILSCEAVTEMHKNLIQNTVIHDSPDDTAVGYGLALWIDTVDQLGSPTQISSPGAFGFTPWIDLEQGYFGIFMIRDKYERTVTPITDLQAIIKNIHTKMNRS